MKKLLSRALVCLVLPALVPPALPLLAPVWAQPNIAASVGAESTQEARPFDHSHGGLTAVLGSVLKGGRVDYVFLRRNPAALDAYLQVLEGTTPAQHAKWTRNQRFAFWINAYNAYTLQLVRDRGPVKSIKKIGGWFTSPWEVKFIDLPAFDPERKNKPLMLDEIEHDILRPTFKDARVHAAINCASKSCPPLRAEAYSAEKLDEQLDDQVALWLADATRNDVVPRGGKIRVSAIFKWFSEDFGKDRAGVVRWIADHVADEALAARLRKDAGSLRLAYLDYDWSLNAQAGKR